MLKIFLIILQFLAPHLKDYVFKNTTPAEWIRKNIFEIVWMSVVVVMFGSVLWMVDLNIALYDSNRKLISELQKTKAEIHDGPCKGVYIQPDFFIPEKLTLDETLTQKDKLDLALTYIDEIGDNVDNDHRAHRAAYLLYLQTCLTKPE